ncbi:hypothetical protein D3C80_866480 [compost metagenome]
MHPFWGHFTAGAKIAVIEALTNDLTNCRGHTVLLGEHPAMVQDKSTFKVSTGCFLWT